MSVLFLPGLGGGVRDLVAEGPFPSRRAQAYRALLAACIVGSTIIAMMGTLDAPWGDAAWLVHWAENAALALLALDYALRLDVARRSRADGDGPLGGLWRYAFGIYGIFDFLAVVPFVIGEAVGLPRDAETVFGILRFLKLARFSPALETLGVVILAELRPLASALFIMCLLAILASTALYFTERAVNPGFASIPHSLWWAVVTLVTLGYGDVVPITGLGRILGGGVAVLGLCMFALPASILASGFAEEMRRQSFVSTWHLVAKVPFFAPLHAGQIAEIASLLKIHRAARGECLVREGDVGETMYFIVSGQVEVRARAGTFVLQNGDFFGEIALVQRLPRTATVKALTRCHLLILDARDFRKFVEAYPNLMEQISETARRRLSGAPEEHPA